MTWIYNGSVELDRQSRYPSIIGSAVATMVLMVLAVAARGYVRLRVVRNIGLDDWLVFVAALTSLLYTIGGIVQTRHGLGLPLAMYPRENFVNAKKINFGFRPFYCISVGCWKIALCHSYLRITSNSHTRIYRRAIWTLLWMVVAFTIYYTLTTAFACRPFKKYWDKDTPGVCLPTPMVYYVPAIITMVLDVALFVLPIPLVARLNMKPKRKWGLVAAFLLGFVTTICSLMRLIGSFEVPKKGDPEYLLTWAVAEMNVGIMTTSLPTLMPLLRRSTWRLADEAGIDRYGKPRSSLSTRLQSLGRRPDNGKSPDTSAQPRSLRRFTSTNQSSQEDILSTTKLHCSNSDPDIEKGTAQWHHDLTYPSLARITRTTDVDVITSDPRQIVGTSGTIASTVKDPRQPPA